MTIEQLNYLLRKELYAIKKHKDNIDRIKKEYFDSNYGLKEGDKIRILHETGDEMIGFLKKVEVCEDGDLYDRNNFIIQRTLHGDFRIRRLTPTDCTRLV